MKTLKTITFSELNKVSMLGTKFIVSGSEIVYIYNTCQLIKNNQFIALNELYNTNSKIGLKAKLFLID